MCGHGTTNIKGIEGLEGSEQGLPRVGYDKRAIGNGGMATKGSCSHYRSYNS